MRPEALGTAGPSDTCHTSGVFQNPELSSLWGSLSFSYSHSPAAKQIQPAAVSLLHPALFGRISLPPGLLLVTF